MQNVLPTSEAAKQMHNLCWARGGLYKAEVPAEMLHDVLRDWYEWEINTLRSQELVCWSVDCRDL